jgi:putative DNA primase/helicase
MTGANLKLQQSIADNMTYPAGSIVDGLRVKRPLRELGNVVLALQNDPLYAVTYNTFAGRVELGGHALTDEDETRIALELGTSYGLVVPTRMVSEAVRYVAQLTRVHPVQAYLGALKWDRQPRIDTWLEDYLQASEVPPGVGRRWLLSAVRRALQPGVKVDTTLILVGQQGAGKSSGMRALMPDPAWFSDTPIDMGSKDAYLAMQGVWCMEVAELSSMRARDAESIKAFLSAQVDRFRPPYGRNMVELPRGTVFVGTTNEQEFLDDPSGARRFWPVKVGRIDVLAITRDRDQLWAEAAHACSRGEPHWLTRDESTELADMQEQYQRTDPWAGRVAEWLQGQPEVVLADVLTEGLRLDAAQSHKGAAMRVAGILTRLGWQKRRVRRAGKRRTVWEPTP